MCVKVYCVREVDEGQSGEGHLRGIQHVAGLMQADPVLGSTSPGNQSST
jgi:hypothetical protein